MFCTICAHSRTMIYYFAVTGQVHGRRRRSQWNFSYVMCRRSNGGIITRPTKWCARPGLAGWAWQWLTWLTRSTCTTWTSIRTTWFWSTARVGWVCDRDSSGHGRGRLFAVVFRVVFRTLIFSLSVSLFSVDDRTDGHCGTGSHDGPTDSDLDPGRLDATRGLRPGRLDYRLVWLRIIRVHASRSPMAFYRGITGTFLWQSHLEILGHFGLLWATFVPECRLCATNPDF